MKICEIAIHRPRQVKPTSTSCENCSKRRLVKFLSRCKFRDVSIRCERTAANNSLTKYENRVPRYTLIHSLASVKRLCFNTVNFAGFQLFELVKLFPNTFITIVSNFHATKEVQFSWLAAANHTAVKTKKNLRREMRCDYRYRLLVIRC